MRCTLGELLSHVLLPTMWFLTCVSPHTTHQNSAYVMQA